jgi:hypothetical protein
MKKQSADNALTTMTIKLPRKLKNQLLKLSVDLDEYMRLMVIEALNDYLAKNK